MMMTLDRKPAPQPAMNLSGQVVSLEAEQQEQQQQHTDDDDNDMKLAPQLDPPLYDGSKFNGIMFEEYHIQLKVTSAVIIDLPLSSPSSERCVCFMTALLK